MDLLKILSFGAILLSVSACILVYISHRRTTARLDALTQANLGITSTIHSLISASMAQQSQVNGQNQTQQSGGTQMTNYSSNDNSIMSNQIAERINVSDDDLSEESEDDYESEDDDITEDNDDGDGDDGSVSSDENEMNDNSLVIGNDSENTIHIVSLHLDNNEHNKFSDSHIEELDDIEPEDSEDDDDEDNLDIDIDELDDNNDNDNDSIKDDDNHINFSVEKLNDNDDIKNNITNVEDDDNDNDMIMPITTSKKTNKKQQGDDDILSKTELFKHLKVDELRKLAIAKHNMSEDDVKKLKKPQLIQRLTQ